jgi:hypothetical protein
MRVMPPCLLSVLVRVPSLLTVEQPAAPAFVVDVGLGPELHRRRVRAGVGLAVADGELDVVLEDHRQELLLEEVAAVGDERLADDADALADLRSAPAGQRFVEDELVDAFALGAAVLLGPSQPEPPVMAERLHERPPLGRVDDLGHVLAGHVEHIGVVVVVQEGLDLGLECLLLGREIEVHRRLPLVSDGPSDSSSLLRFRCFT